MYAKLFCLVYLSFSLSVACSNKSEKDNAATSQIKNPILNIKNRSPTSVLNYFDSLIQNNQVIAGQHLGDGADEVGEYYDRFITPVKRETGKTIALIGADFGWKDTESYPIDALVGHWNKGGLITISWHADNPFAEGAHKVRTNSVENQDQINLRALLKQAPTSKAKQIYRSELHKVAVALQRLKKEGVTVIWRPFHEMNADWFWWGIDAYSGLETNPDDYIALWKDMVQTFKEDYDLDNLLWVYSPAEFYGWNSELLAYYPGDNWVDIVGMSYYGPAPDFKDYEILRTTGKTIALTEAGPNEESYGKWDEAILAKKLQGKAAYFLQWHSWAGASVAIKDNLNMHELMNSPNVITLEDIATTQ